MPDKEPKRQIRVKDASVNVEGLTPRMQDFYFELEDGLKTYYPDGGYNLIVTSAKRKPSDGIGKAKKVSHHNTGNAIDVRPDEKVFNYLYNTPKGLETLSKFGLGLLDETSEETLSKTGGTAPHLHIGADSKYVELVRNRYEVATKMPDAFQAVPMGSSGTDHDHDQGTDHDKGVNLPHSRPYIPRAEEFTLNPNLETNDLENLFIADLNREIGKQQIIEEKKETSPNRAELEDKIKQKQKQEVEFMESLAREMEAGNQTTERTRRPNQGFEEENFEAIETQNELPKLPSIFTT